MVFIRSFTCTLHGVGDWLIGRLGELDWAGLAGVHTDSLRVHRDLATENT
jgi:hypothetical protein